jgi:hypothetical protein
MVMSTDDNAQVDNDTYTLDHTTLSDAQMQWVRQMQAVIDAVRG